METTNTDQAKMKETSGQNIPKLVIKKVLHAKRERVFEAWTNPKLLQQWLVPPPEWTARSRNDLKVGGTYHHEMIVGTSELATSFGYPAGEVLMHEGEYLEITPPERLVFTWNSHAVQDTRVTIELKDLGDTTELWLTHELLNTEMAHKSHSDGWNAALEKLEQLLTGRFGEALTSVINHTCGDVKKAS